MESPREGAVERLFLKSLVACQSILGLVATGLAGSWWGLGVVRIGGPDPVNPGLGALGGSLV